MEEHAAPAVPAEPPGGAARRAPASSLGDDALADEIELYGAVVVAASEKEGSLTHAEIDEALGVPAPGAAGARSPGAQGPSTPADGGGPAPGSGAGARPPAESLAGPAAGVP